MKSSFLQDKCLRVQLLSDLMVVARLVFEDTGKVFSRVAALFYISSSRV